MKQAVLPGLILLGAGISLLRAGSIIPLANSPEVDGKLTLGSTSIRVDDSSKEINLSDILEADLGNAPFQLNFYYSSTDKGTQLPPNWKGQDIGPVEAAGSVADASGTFTMSGSGTSPNGKKGGGGTRTSDMLYFAGQQWTGNGQWTAQVRKISTEIWETGAGMMLRDTLDPASMMFALGVGTASNGGLAVRPEAGKPAQGTSVPMDLPIWMRLTRYGPDVFAAISTDGKEWEQIGQNNFRVKGMENPWIGFFVDSRRDKGLGKAAFDNVSFTPAPSTAEILPPGVLLQSGSFLAGYFERLTFDPATPDAEGTFIRSGKRISIPRSKIAAILMLPTKRSQIADMASHVGLLMKNGDIMDGDFDSINAGQVLINSVLLGITTYSRSEVRGCFLHPVQISPANYTVRLRDASSVNSNAVNIDGSSLSVAEISGVNVPFTPDEAVQFRAGPSFIQPLAELTWKATPPPPSAALPVIPTTGGGPTVSNTPSTNAAPAAAAPAMAPAPDETLPPVQSWQGPNQEQVMVASTGTMIDFPLTAKFRAIAVRVALSSDSPANAQMTVRVLADGRDIGRTPPFKAGDQPRFMEISLQSPKTVTLQAESVYAGVKAVFIDPIAVRDN